MDINRLKREYATWRTRYADKVTLMVNDKKAIIDGFQSRFLQSGLQDLTLEKYTSIKEINDDSFLNWLERKSKPLGSIYFPSANELGLYYSTDHSYIYSTKSTDSRAISEDQAKIIFEEYFKPFWIKVLDLDQEKKFKDVVVFKPKMLRSKQTILRFLCLIDPTNFVNIYKSEYWDILNQEFNITDEDDYFQKAFEVSQFFIKNLNDDPGVIASYLFIRYIKKPNHYFTVEEVEDYLKSINVAVSEIKMPEKQNDKIASTRKQIILYGPPGTGKTYITKKFVYDTILGMVSELDQDTINEEYSRLKREGRVVFLTFHPSYSYEEFIEGITVDLSEEGKNSNYRFKQGIFKKLCTRALACAIEANSTNKKHDDLNPDDRYAWRNILQEYKELISEMSNEELNAFWNKAPKFAIVIDEINRGDPSKIFGELITLLESDKRLGQENELEVKLPYTDDDYAIPPSVFIIGTMNTADRSIALVDIALRRRFAFIEMLPDFDDNGPLMKRLNESFEGNIPVSILKTIEAIRKINDNICENPLLGKDKMIGHSFFFKLANGSDVDTSVKLLWRYEILPLLEEYCYGRYTELNRILFESDESNYITGRGINYPLIESKLFDQNGFIEEIK